MSLFETQAAEILEALRHSPVQDKETPFRPIQETEPTIEQRLEQAASDQPALEIETQLQSVVDSTTSLFEAVVLDFKEKKITRETSEIQLLDIRKESLANLKKAHGARNAKGPGDIYERYYKLIYDDYRNALSRITKKPVRNRNKRKNPEKETTPRKKHSSTLFKSPPRSPLQEQNVRYSSAPKHSQRLSK